MLQIQMLNFFGNDIRFDLEKFEIISSFDNPIGSFMTPWHPWN
jgi:hypothetical protein